MNIINTYFFSNQFNYVVFTISLRFKNIFYNRYFINFSFRRYNSNYDPIGEENIKSLELKIDNTIVTVTWLDNSSVNALKELAKDGLIINMHKYSVFEQTGMLGSTISSNDSRIDEVPGDIVLYNSSNIVLYYASNTWSYTRLGKMDLPEQEVIDLLSNGNVTIKISR